MIRKPIVCIVILFLLTVAFFAKKIDAAEGKLQNIIALKESRFKESDKEAIVDTVTGLMWTKNANLIGTRDPGFDNDGAKGDGRVTWQHALDYVAKLNKENYLGHNDWQVPTREQLYNLLLSLPVKFPFIHIMASNYWTSELSPLLDTLAMTVDFTNGTVVAIIKSETGFVWPVRKK